MPPDGRTLVLTDLERRLALRTIVGFDALGDDALAALAGLAHRRDHAAGATIVPAGAARDSLPLVLAGELQLERGGRRWQGADAQHLLELLWLARDTMPLTLKTATGAVVLELPFAALEEALEEHFASWLATTRALAARLLHEPAIAKATTLERHALHHRPGLVERVTALQEALPFAHAYVDALLQLDEEAIEVRFDRGAVIWRRGDAAHSLLVPLDGALRGADGDAPVGLGGLELLAALPRAAQLEAAQPLTALRVPEESLLDLLEDHHALARDLTATLAAALIPRLESAARPSRSPTPAAVAAAEP